MSLFSFQLLSQVKIGPKDETQLTRTHRIINKSLWLIGTSRNAILVVVCGFIGYAVEDTNELLLTGKYHVNASYTGLFISPSGISELDCATTKTDTAERSISIGRESLQVFFVLGALAYFQVPPLGGSREEKWRSQ